MGILNWRREGLFLAIAGMETCWIVGWSRILMAELQADIPELSWWSLFALYAIGLTTARLVSRLEPRYGPWIIAGLALLTSLLLLLVNLGWTSSALFSFANLSSAESVVTLLFGFLIWILALRTPAQAGDTRAVARRFQIGIALISAFALATLRVPALQQRPGQAQDSASTGLIVAYFGCGLLAVALTRIEEVARTEPSGAAPFNVKWIVTLAATLLVAGVSTLLATNVLTVDAIRWLLRPVGNVLNALLYAIVFIATWALFALISLLLPLIQALFHGVLGEEGEQTIQEWMEASAPTGEGEEVASTLIFSPQFLEALRVLVIALISLLLLWGIIRAFRRWQMQHYTAGGVREPVAPDRSLAQDLAEFLKDQWKNLQTADLRHLFQRRGTGSARAIYANLLALLAQAGYPRQPEQTPYEYQPAAGQALPTRQAEISTITEAYVRAHYGEVEISPQELSHLQDAWKRIQSEKRTLL